MLKKWCFSKKNREIMKAVMRAIIPRGGAFEAGADDYDLLPEVEKIVSTYNPLFRKMIPFILIYMQYSSLLNSGSRFTKLSPEKAERRLASFESSCFYHNRMMILLLKLLTFLAFYDIDEAASQIGYTHGCHLPSKGRARA